MKQILMTAVKTLVKMEVPVKMESVPIHANALKVLKVCLKYKVLFTLANEVM